MVTKFIFLNLMFFMKTLKLFLIYFLLFPSVDSRVNHITSINSKPIFPSIGREEYDTH